MTFEASIRLMVLAVRARLGEGVTEEAARLLETSDDWSALPDLAARHGLTVLLYSFLRATPFTDVVPAGVSSALRAMSLSQAAATASALGQLPGLAAALGEVAPSTIWLKGPVLSQLVYGDPLIRPFGDFDLLIREPEWERVYAALLELGYYPDGEEDTSRLPPRLTDEDMLDHWLSFSRTDHPSIDCTLDPLELGLRMRTLDEAFESAVPVELEGASVKALDPEYQLVTLCVHLNRHGFQGLRWFADIAALISSRAIRSDRVVEICRTEDISASVYGVLRHVGQLFDCSVGEDAMRELRPGLARRFLWTAIWPNRAIARFGGRRDVGIVFPKSRGRQWLIPNLILTGRVSDKLRYFVRKLLPPADYIAHTVPTLSPDSNRARQLLLRYAAAIGRRRLRRDGRLAGSPPQPERAHGTPTRGSEPAIPDGVVAGVERAAQPSAVRASVVVATYEHAFSLLLVECLEGLNGQSVSDFEVIVVSNGPCGVVDEIRRRHWSFPLSLLRLSENHGQSLAYNAGARLAAGTVLCFLDDDAVPRADWIEQHLRAHEGGAVAVRGGIVPRNQANGLNVIEFGGPNGTTRGQPTLLDREGNMSVVRESFCQVGGLDSRQRGGAGAELTYRLVQSGVERERIVAWPDAEIAHDHASGPIDLIEKHFRWGAVSASLAVSRPQLARFYGSYGEQRVRLHGSASRGFLPTTAALAGRLGWHVGEIGALLRAEHLGSCHE